VKLAGLRIAIGGAGQGVGAACARVFAAQGARLLLCSRTETDLLALADELRGINALLEGREPEVFCLAADLSTDEGAALFAKTAHETLGGVDLGLLCAGASMRAELLASAAPNPAGDAARLLGQFRGNTLAPALGAIALARAWAPEDAREAPPLAGEAQDTHAGGGRAPPIDRQILVLSSLVTRLHAQQGLGPYLAAKVALEALVRTLAEELWPRIRVNALCLGPVATRLHEQAGTPPEVIAQFPSPEEVTPRARGARPAGSPHP
jgi:NAD(P)-dependent dehydrogenase (short-subunit alcohol dehydrogenase family)